MKEENFFRCFCSGRLNFTSILFVHVAFAVAISAVVAGCATAATAVAVATCNWQLATHVQKGRRHMQAPNNLSFFAIRVGVGGDDQCFEL